MDVEQVPLINGDATMRITATPLAIQLVGQGAPPNVGDNLLQIKPGEAGLAVVSYPITDPTFPFQEMVSADFALIYDPNFKTSPYKLVPGVALQANEADPVINGKSLATFATLPSAY